MANIHLSDHFFYFFIKDRAPPEFKPILQVCDIRKTTNGFRMKLYDGVFSYSACYLQGEALIEKFKKYIEKNTPKIRITSWEQQVTSKKVFYINDMEIVDQLADGTNIIEAFPLTDPAHYDDYMVSNNFIFPPQTENVLKPPAKRARMDAGIPSHVPTGSANALNVYRSPTKISASATARSPLRSRFPSTSIRQIPGDQNITPLTLITPFINRWRICGLITFKEKVREVNSAAKGIMRVMSFHLTDEQGKTIKLTAWNELADEFNAIVNESQAYYVSGEQGCIKKKNIRFNTTDCDYEISLNPNCQVTACTDRHFEPPKFLLKRTFLNDLTPDKHCVDVLAVIDKIGEKTNQLVKSKSEEVPKRDVQLVDESNASVTLTLWAEMAEIPMGGVGDVIGIKSAFVREFNGSLSLSVQSSSIININPDIPDSAMICDWYTTQRDNVEIKSLSSMGSNSNFSQDLRSLGIIKLSNLADPLVNGPNGVYFYTKAEIIEVRKDNAYYPSCMTCKKKVMAVDNGFRCESCNVTHPEFQMRYNLSIQLCDGMDTIYVTLFDDLAKDLLNIGAQELDNIRNSGNEPAYQAYFTPLMFKSVAVRARVKREMYNDQHRLKYTVFQIKPIPYTQYTEALDNTLKMLEDL